MLIFQGGRSHSIHGTGIIYLHEWLIFMVNVVKYTIHGSSGGLFPLFLFATTCHMFLSENQHIPWNNDGWETSLSFWVLAHFEGLLLVLGRVADSSTIFKGKQPPASESLISFKGRCKNIQAGHHAAIFSKKTTTNTYQDFPKGAKWLLKGVNSTSLRV